jgi:hypothetical protein
MRKLVTYGAGLIALYLVVEYSTGSGSLLKNGSAGVATVVKSLQGR